jgi:hypothetical protein
MRQCKVELAEPREELLRMVSRRLATQRYLADSISAKCTLREAKAGAHAQRVRASLTHYLVPCSTPEVKHYISESITFFVVPSCAEHVTKKIVPEAPTVSSTRTPHTSLIIHAQRCSLKEQTFTLTEVRTRNNPVFIRCIPSLSQEALPKRRCLLL